MISQLMQEATSFLEPAAEIIKNMINENLVFWKRNFVVRKCCVYATEPFNVMTLIPTNTNSAAQASKTTLEDCGDGPMTKYRKVLDEFINVTSTNRGFRTVHHNVATFEQTKKVLPCFYPKKIADADGIHNRPLNL